MVGCGGGNSSSDKAQNQDYEKMYAPVLEDLAQIIQFEDVDKEIRGRPKQLLDYIKYEVTLGMLVEYSIQDVVGDDTPELIIAEIREIENETFFGNYVHEIYTIENGQAELIAEASEYESIEILNDRTIFKSASVDDYQAQLITVSKWENEKWIPIDIYKSRYNVETSKLDFF